ncbi:MAG: hypothetical protein U1E76_28075 [Planctomycetota bacterium]
MASALGATSSVDERDHGGALAERIARIEQGLLPRVAGKGQIGGKRSIADEMRARGIPA